jgi:ketosteroid isomerase-like protein
MSATTTRHGVVAGDIALASASWEIRGTGPDGDPVEVPGASADLLRRHGDGRWLLVVDHPFGGS